jgi:LysM repeat protein
VPIGSYKSPPKKVYYTVKKGDTLSEIAVKYKTSVSKIKKWNGLRNNTIYPGKKLVIHK